MQIRIEINSPKEIEGKAIQQQVDKLIKAGFKTYEIDLTLNFITDSPQAIFNRFRQIKNQAALNRDESRWIQSNTIDYPTHDNLY